MPSPNATHRTASNVLAARPPPGRKSTAAAISSMIATLRAVFTVVMASVSAVAGSGVAGEAQSTSASRRAYASSTARVAAVWRASDLAASYWSPTPPGRPAPPRASRSAASACSTARSAFCCSLRRFLDGPFGFALGFALAARASRRRSPARRRSRSCAGAVRARHRARAAGTVGRAAAPWRARRGARRRPALLAHAHVLRPAADVAVQRARPRRRPCGCRPRRAARGRGRRAAPRPGTRAARPRAPRGSRCRGGWWARRGSARWRRSWTSTASDSRRRSPPERPASGFSASSPENRKRPSSARALFGRQAGGALRGVEHALARRGRPRRAPRRAGRGSRPCTLWPVLSLPAASAPRARRASRSASSCRCRWGRRARRARRVRATARRARAAPSGRLADLDAPVAAARRSRARSAPARRTRTPGPAPSRGSRSMRSIFSSFLTRDCACLAFVAL